MEKTGEPQSKKPIPKDNLHEHTKALGNAAIEQLKEDSNKNYQELVEELQKKKDKVLEQIPDAPIRALVEDFHAQAVERSRRNIDRITLSGTTAIESLSERPIIKPSPHSETPQEKKGTFKRFFGWIDKLGKNVISFLRRHRLYK